MRYPAWLCLLLLLPALSAFAEVVRVPMSISGRGFEVELAATDETRRLGLMHRKELAEGHGMLFIFPEPGIHKMWMSNTHIPLSVAFLDERGVMLSIVDMEPHSEEFHGAIRPAKDALEMNRSWLARQGLKPGARLGAETPLAAGE